MATLEKIRKRGPLVAIIIGIALLAFVLGDMVRSGQPFMASSQNAIAEIAGSTISYQEYGQRVEEIAQIYKNQSGRSSLDENLMEQIRTEVWEQMVKEKVLAEDYENLGIGVSSDEVFDMVQGQNIDPTIRQLFTNPETGEYNSAAVVNFFKNMDQDENQKMFGLYLENLMVTNRISAKYNNLVSKAMYVTKKQTETEFKDRNHMVDFKYIAVNYNTIADSTIAVTNSELSEYYSKHKKEYEQEEARDIAYVTFDIVPSNEDMQVAEQEIQKIKQDFTVNGNEKSLILDYSETPYDESFHSKTQTGNAQLDTFLFINGKVNEVFGPVMENYNYKLVKIMQIKQSPDSVKARHILIRPKKADVADTLLAKTKIDSIKKVLDKKGDFEKLAKEFSEDQGSAVKGGDLGWFTEGMMVKEFNDACFKGKKGDKVVVTTQFGVHLIEITEQTKPVNKVQYATIDRKIEASEKTLQAIYNDASKFAGMNTTREMFDKAIEKENGTIVKKVAPNLQPNDKVIAGIENAREVIRWAYNAKKDEVSSVFELGNRYVVATLTDVREKGIAPLEQVKEMVTAKVRQDKKAEILIKKVKENTGSSIDEMATKLGSQVKEAKNISFSTYQIPEAGYEPAILAKAVLTEKDKITDPIVGKTGVFVLVVTTITPSQSTENVDLSMEKNRISSMVKARATYQAYDAMKQAANIVDKRAKFF